MAGSKITNMVRMARLDVDQAGNCPSEKIA